MKNSPAILDYGVPERRYIDLWPFVRWLFRVFVCLIVIIAAFMIGTAINHAYQMHRVTQRAAQLQQAISADVRFARVKSTPFKRYSGSVFITGTVETSEDLSALKRIVYPSSVKISWFVRVGHPSAP